MRFRRKTGSLLVSILLVSLLLSFIPQAALEEEEQKGIDMEFVDTVVAGTPHGPIVISSNDMFRSTAESESWAGNGSESDPFIIEDFDFDLGGTAGKCIDIQDTTVHFIIRDCTFTGASLSGGVGIRLYNVTNCEVSENILYDNYYGMSLRIENSTIVNNEVLSTVSVGFYVGITENSIISENTIRGGLTGLVMDSSQHCEIINNTISDSTQALMYFYFCDYITISDNDLINGIAVGQYHEYSDNCTIIRNTYSECGEGVFLSNARDNSIVSCNLERNTHGIVFDDMGSAGENVIEWCEFRDNVGVGILVENSGYRNLIRWNIFVNNSMGGAFCDGSENIFDYNYYEYYTAPDDDGDKIVDFPKSIPGAAGEEDPHPLVLFPAYPEWESLPSNQTLEFGDEFSYTLSIMPTIPIREWEISDTVRFVIDKTGTIRDIDILDVGTYQIDVLVTNVYDLSLEASFTLTVTDSMSPVWMSLIQDKTFSFGEDIEIQLMAWDLAGIDSWYISDSENFSVSSASLIETGILTIVGIENLVVGTYPLTITAYDPSGNYVTATLTVTVTTSGAAAGDTEPVFIMSTAGLSLGILALIIGIVSLRGSRKGT